jgi:hypothetical protein
MKKFLLVFALSLSVLFFVMHKIYAMGSAQTKVRLKRIQHKLKEKVRAEIGADGKNTGTNLVE